jgi:hypothetical protein
MPTKEGLAKLYDTVVWQRRRALHLKQFPLRAECLRARAVTPATCVDHVERWRAGRADDINRFLLEPIQSLCENCHNRKTTAERLGNGPVISKQIPAKTLGVSRHRHRRLHHHHQTAESREDW